MRGRGQAEVVARLRDFGFAVHEVVRRNGDFALVGAAAAPLLAVPGWAKAAVIGVATNGTAANGMALTANGGFTLGSGAGTRYSRPGTG